MCNNLKRIYKKMSVIQLTMYVSMSCNSELYIIKKKIILYNNVFIKY